MRVAKGGFSGLEAPKIFGLRFGDESHHRNSSTVLSGCVCVCVAECGGVRVRVTCVSSEDARSGNRDHKVLT